MCVGFIGFLRLVAFVHVFKALGFTGLVGFSICRLVLQARQYSTEGFGYIP